ncbi:3-demethylubiquinone-9 3-methyltransferase [Plasmodium vivax India VII]|uniref:3-demethylubiquinone-9 3-methyltransferase n=3 Tax=Plasmodium vivax TaxID=5855 RepID=A0A0J9SIV9_PLAVI|nr:3-demethylubiquinone-9 3-methyltransferase [Plasmodium vivax India VII]
MQHMQHMQHLLGGLKPSGGNPALVGRPFLRRQRRHKTFDERERAFFDQMHSEWWNDHQKAKPTWCDVLHKVAGANTYSLHDYNRHRFHFISRNYAFLFYEKMKEGGQQGRQKEGKRKGEEKESKGETKENKGEHPNDITINVLDVGCGGGILCEYMRRNFPYFCLQSDVVGRGAGCGDVPGRKVQINIDGIDVSSKLIDVARRRQQAEGAQYTGVAPLHTSNGKGDIPPRPSRLEEGPYWGENQRENTPWSNLNVQINQSYYNCDVSDFTKWSNREGKRKYNIVVSSEVIEHVPNGKKEEHIRCISQLCSPEALVVFTTIGKNFLSYLYSIILAEYVTGMVKKGTHNYEQFIGSDQLTQLCALFDLQNLSTEHAVYVPFLRDYFPTRWLRLLYLSAFVYRGGG